MKKDSKIKNEKLYIVMPAYNERDSIEEVVNQWYPIIEKLNKDSRLIIVNDGSKDDTYEIMQKLAKTRPQFIPLTKKNGGHGSTLIYAYNYAIEEGADWIFQTDSDGQTNPNEFKDFWDLRTKYEAILGNRTVRGDGNQRKFVEKTLCTILRTIFGVKVPDANAPFRLMKASLVKKYLGRMRKDYNLPNVMLTVFYKYYNEKLEFKEISFKPRQAGVNSINIKKIVKIGFNALKDFRNFKKEMKKDAKN